MLKQYSLITSTLPKPVPNENSVKLVIVTKKQSVDKFLPLYEECGHRCFGESYFNEFRDKIRIFNPNDVEWHFIGPLQGNKIRPLLKLATSTIKGKLVIQSISGGIEGIKRVLKPLSSLEPSLPYRLPIMLQINCSGEQEKSGSLPSEVEGMVGFLKEDKEAIALLDFQGFMCIGSKENSSKSPNPDFVLLRQLRDRWAPTATLSMGMSSDYLEAIREGTGIVRLGSCFFS